MVMFDDKISPEEKLLKVIKGENVPVQSKANTAFVGSRTGTVNSVVPPLSSVLESIINASGSPVVSTMSPAQAAFKPLSFQEQQAMIHNLAATYSAAPPLPPAHVPTTQAAVKQKPYSAPTQPVVVPVSNEVPKPQPVVQPVVPAKAVSAAPAKVEVIAGPVKDEFVSRVPLSEQKTAPSFSKPVSEAAPIAAKPVPLQEVTAPNPAAVPVAVPVAVVASVGKTVTPVSTSGVDLPAPSSVASQPVVKATPASQPAPKPVVPPSAKQTTSAPVAQPLPKPVTSSVSKVESKPLPPVPVQSAKSAPQEWKEQPKPAVPVAVAAIPPKTSAPLPKPQPVQKVEPKPTVPQPAAAPKAQVSTATAKPAESPKTVATKPPLPTEKPKVAAPAPAEEKPKLKVAKSDVPVAPDVVKPSEAKVQPKVVSAERTGDVEFPPPTVFAKKPEEKKRYVIRNVNLGLVAAILLLIAFSVSEIFAKLRTEEQLNRRPSAVETVVPGPNGQDTGQIYKLPDLETIVQAMGDRPMLSMPGQRVKEVPVEGAAKAPQMMDWMKYVQDSIKLMGFSGNQVEGTQQAIIQEGKDKDSRINFFKPGQKVQIQGRDIQVESIRDDQVILTDGQRKMTLK